jgi:hypothetical protein
MKPPLSRAYKVNDDERMFGTKENGVPDPRCYDAHVNAPQEIARMWAGLVASGVACVRCAVAQTPCPA